MSKKNIFLTVGFAAALLAIPLLYAWKGPKHGAMPPILGTVPANSFVNEQGQPFALASLSGKVWVVDFVFTSCKESCPGLTQAMKALQERVKKTGLTNVALISISVDPETDTPEKLSAYAAKAGADPALWTFLTGDLKTLEETIVKGFRVSMERGPGAEKDTVEISLLTITHGNRFILVDRQLQIRGYYDVMADGSDLLFADLKRL